jgi:hypothetical protein
MGQLRIRTPYTEQKVYHPLLIKSFLKMPYMRSMVDDAHSMFSCLVFYV